MTNPGDVNYSLDDEPIITAPPIVEALKSPEVCVVFNAARALAYFPANYRAKRALLAALGDHNLPAIAGAYDFFLDWGGPSSTEGLPQSLNQFGDKDMAQRYLNSHNSTLEDAAGKWPSAHGYAVHSERIQMN